MPLLVPNEGEVRLLTDLLSAGANWTLRLFKTNTAPAETDTFAANGFVEADFTNYTSKTLTRSVSGSTWSTPASVAPTSGWSAEASVAESTYQQQSWTCGATGNTIYGYYVQDGTNSRLILAELFGTPRTLANTDVLNLTPRIGLA